MLVWAERVNTSALQEPCCYCSSCLLVIMPAASYYSSSSSSCACSHYTLLRKTSSAGRPLLARFHTCARAKHRGFCCRRSVTSLPVDSKGVDISCASRVEGSPTDACTVSSISNTFADFDLEFRLLSLFQSHKATMPTFNS